MAESGRQAGEEAERSSLPEPLALASNSMWLSQIKWTEEIQVVNANLRELVQRR